LLVGFFNRRMWTSTPTNKTFDAWYEFFVIHQRL
jgi:hypothetical protein